MKLKKFFSILIALIVLLSSALICSATWYDDVSGGSYVTISGSPYVADTFYGVQARYSLITSVYQCNELVNRFYEQAYGLDIFAGLSSGPIMRSEGYEFKTPSIPHPGDIVFTTESMRKAGAGNHWAIVKSYNNGKITLFEQNVTYNGKAGVGRTLNYPSSYYYLYTPVAKEGYSEPTLKEYTGSQDYTASNIYISTDVTTFDFSSIVSILTTCINIVKTLFTYISKLINLF